MLRLEMLRLDIAASRRWVRALPQIYLVHWADLTGLKSPNIPNFAEGSAGVRGDLLEKTFQLLTSTH